MMQTPFPLVRACILTLLASAAAPVAVTVTLITSFLYLPVPELPEPRPPVGVVSRVFDVNGEEIGQFRQFEQNIPVGKGDIPLHLKQAVVASEDRKFYSHRGLDLRAILRAASADLRSGEIRQGGSTITQQYVKLAYTGRERTVRRKLGEAILASQLDRRVPKDDILFNYLSSIYLGGGAYGVAAASETYFRKPVSQVTLSEAALLAGLIPAPSRYDPRTNPSLAEQKRVAVLERMLEQGYIDDKQYAEARFQRVYYAARGLPIGPATVVYPSEAPLTQYPYFVDYVRRYVESKIGRDAVYRGGLEIRTSLDPKIQGDAERAVTAALDGVGPPIEMALVAVEPVTGFVKAMVGGRDFYGPEGQVNLALGKCHRAPEKVRSKVDVGAECWDPEAVVVEGGGTGRQPGSAWKPFVLATAFEKGVPEGKVYSAPSRYRFKNCTGDYGCVIENYEGSAGGRANLRRATARSYNTVYAQLIQDVGIPDVGEMAKKLGITNAWVANPEVHGPSYAIGVQEVAPLDMAAAFGVFAARGLRNPATPVLWVKDFKGKFLENNRERQPKRVLDEAVAYNVTDVLREVIAGGTGKGADIGRPAAGKTGTAQEWRDAWFVGYTPTLSASVWIGNKERPTSLFDIKGVARVTGGSIPAETWKAFMLEALKDVPVSDFEKPPPPPPPPPLPTTTTSSVPPEATSTTSTSSTTSTTYDFYFPDDTSTTVPRSTTTTTTRPRGILPFQN
jgi:penicillin-binding protein 1A